MPKTKTIHRRYDDRPHRADDLGILAVCNNINGPITDADHLTSDPAKVTCGRCIRIRDSIPQPENIKPFSNADLRRISRDIGKPEPYAVVDVTTDEIVERFETDVAAATKAAERPRDWLAVHESHLPSMGISRS